MSTRTTLTLDDDVAAGLAREVRRTGKPYRAVVNAALRAGLERRDTQAAAPFVVEPRDLGARPGADLDSVSALLEVAEGPGHR